MRATFPHSCAVCVTLPPAHAPLYPPPLNTHGDRSGTSVEIDAYNVGHDLSRGQSQFTRVAKPQLDPQDRLADPAVQEAHDELDRVDLGGEHDGAGAGGFDRPEEAADTDDYQLAGASGA